MSSSFEMMREMGRRVDLPLRVVSEIFYMGLTDALRKGTGTVDMVLMAQAIKYASDNRADLNPKFFTGTAQQTQYTKPANFTFLK